MAAPRSKINFVAILFAALCLAFHPDVAVGEIVICEDVMLVKTVSGPSETCEGFDTGGNAHFWPLGGDATGCHGWRATDFTGKVHDNSANNIRCSGDGTRLLYDQFAATIDCSPSEMTPEGVPKEFVFNECHQGVPPTLYDTALNLECCANPSSDACQKGVPVAINDATTDDVVFWNGRECAASLNAGTEPSGTYVTYASVAEAGATEPSSTEAAASDGTMMFAAGSLWIAFGVTLLYGLL